MECNKEEAIRVKGLAEKKMENKDFPSAKRLASKAKKLYPDLENISQMIMVCDVLCSAENKVCGNENNWYGILQIEPTADDASIRTQYRKFALSLHPDKNKFSGASDAFRLISEAQKFLLDREKRMLYDSKLKAARGSHGTTQSNAQRQPGRQNIVNNNGSSQFSNKQPHQFVDNQSTFWTVCPFCSVRYQYYMVVIHKIINCQKCKNYFKAYDMKNPGSTTTTNFQPGFPGPKESTNQDNSKMGSRGSEKSNANMATESNVSREKPTDMKTGFTSKGVTNCMSTEESGNVESHSKESGQFGEPTSRSGKKRKTVVGSGGSSSNAKEEIILEDGDSGGSKNSECNGVLHPRRSRHVSYDANGKADNMESPLKRSKPNESFHGTAEEIDVHGTKKEDDCFVDVERHEKQETGNHGCSGEKESLNGKMNAEKASEKTDEHEDDKKTSSVSSDSCYSSIEPEVYQCPDPEFSNFDNDRNEESFAVGQIWAVYDNLDAMPRYYALISKVFSPGFKLRIAWLEPDPDDEMEIKWVEEGLPASCGKFKRAKGTECTEDHPMFSHLVYWEKGPKGGTYKIHPRKGETWAIFKDWDINWHSNPEAEKKYEYEFVEVLSDYVDGIGVRVTFLAKVKGFAFLFCRRLSEATNSDLISAKEILRFSHRVPSFQLTGKEREDVPKGSFELDPAALPSNINETVASEGLNVEDGETCMGSRSKSLEKSAELKEKLVGNSTQVGIAESIAGSMAESLENMVNQKEESAKFSSSAEMVKPKSEFVESASLVKGNSTASEADNRSHLDSSKSSSDILMEDSFDSTATVEVSYDIPEQELYNFDLDKSPDKFQIDQIWAIYSDEDTLPKYYGKIKKIDHSPVFKLYVTWLEACSPPKDIVAWVNDEIPICCGKFKLMKGKPDTYTDTNPFSHLVRAERTKKKDVFAIFPRKGEVWALYKNWHAGMTLSDLVNCKYEIVEVMEENDSGIKVLVLELVEGFKSVFRPQKKGQSNVEVQISRAELLRFSHQVPAFQLTEEKGGSLRGFWELDTAALFNF